MGLLLREARGSRGGRKEREGDVRFSPEPTGQPLAKPMHLSFDAQMLLYIG